MGELRNGLPGTDPRPWFDHVAFVVPDLRGPAQLVQDALGATFLRGADSPKYGFRSAQFQAVGAKIELITPLDVPEGAPIRAFLAERGAGVHHLTFLTGDVVALASDVAACGWTTTGTDLSEPHWRETYLGPRQGLGTIVQFADSDFDWSLPDLDHSFEDVLGGLREWRSARSVARD